MTKGKLSEQKDLKGDNNMKFKFYNKDYTLDKTEEMNKIVESYYPGIETIISRWNISWNVKEYIHDTTFMATFIIDNLVKLNEKVTAVAYLTISDIISDWPTDESPFFGGRGLFNTEGIKKSAYYAFVFLFHFGWIKVIFCSKNFKCRYLILECL